MRRELCAISVSESLHPGEIVRDLFFIKHRRWKAQVFMKQVPTQFRDLIGSDRLTQASETFSPRLNQIRFNSLCHA